MINFNDLKKKYVVNILDGRKLGKIKDVIFSFPEGRITSFVVGEDKLFSVKDQLVIELCCINKIGDDTVLVSLSKSAEMREDAEEVDL